MKFFIKIFKSLKSKGFIGFIIAINLDLIGVIVRKLHRVRDYYTLYKFHNYASQQSTLIVILAGYKSYLWASTLKSIVKYQPNNVDVCIVSAGLNDEKLLRFCESNKWSYLSTSRNSPGIALNKAIELHPQADFIYKLDEDIIVGPDFFEKLLEGYKYTHKNSLLEPGFVAPVLNVNGVSYAILLRALGLEKQYEEIFGQIVSKCGDLPVHYDPEAAWWLWKNTLPFKEKSLNLSKSGISYTVCPTRFSIGAILFRREFIEQIGGLKSSWYTGVLGVDEDELCKDCVSASRPIYIINNVLAGHFSFFPQEKFMKSKLSEMAMIDPDSFSVK